MNLSLDFTNKFENNKFIVYFLLIMRLAITPRFYESNVEQLISIEKNEEWLSARGRGGGLAIWVKDK